MKNPPPQWELSFGGRLGVAYEKVGEGHAIATLVVGPEHCNPTGVCHGGAIFSFADDTMGAAAHTLSPEGKHPTSVQANVSFMRSARSGDLLRAETCTLSRGRRTAHMETRVEDEGGRLVATVVASLLFVEARPRG